MFRITPGHDDDSTQAQNLAHLVTPDYYSTPNIHIKPEIHQKLYTFFHNYVLYTQTLGNNTQAHPSQTQTWLGI